MITYSQEFKLKVVKEYLDGKGSYSSLSKKYEISHSAVSAWVKKYNMKGEDALKNGNSITPYSVKFKLNAIELYKTTDISYRELAQQLDVSSRSMLQRWVKQYDAKGIEGISQTRSASKKMKKKESNSKNEISIDGLTDEEIKEKILHLEIENAYLKELWSLRNKENTDSKTKRKHD